MDNKVIEKYKEAKSRLLLFDYDGTLVDFASLPKEALPSKELLRTLKELAGKPRTKVVIITGRAWEDMDTFVGSLPIGIIAEHGAMLKENGRWQEQSGDDRGWKKYILPILNEASAECPGSFVEEKHFSLTWHYRNAESESGDTHSRELIRILESIIPSYNLKILDGNKVVEIMNKEIGKGKAVKNLVEQNNYDYILSIGDDKTDEEMFEFFLHSSNAVTVKVGNGNTFAKYKLDNVNNVISLLEQLSQ